MVYDTARQRAVIFGGEYFDCAPHCSWLSRQTWEWDGAVWRLRAEDGPCFRMHHGMAYDPVRAVTLLFGGILDRGECITPPTPQGGDTWLWDGERWTEFVSPGSPPYRSVPAMAFDEARQVVFLFGGNQSGRGLLSDTWEWDGAQWIERTVPGPSGRAFPAIAYHPGRQSVILFGGTESNTLPLYLNDTWQWDGAHWKELHFPVRPSPRYWSRMVYDAARDVIVLFGGEGHEGESGETWELRLCGPCYADCDTSTGEGVLDIFDFLCFQNRYDAGASYACDCDTSTGKGVCDVFDFLCFQNAYDAGCP